MAMNLNSSMKFPDITQFPDWALWGITLTASLLVASAGTVLVRRIHPRLMNEPQLRETVEFIVNGSFVLFGLLMALIAVVAYDQYSAALSATQQEAAELISIHGISESLPESSSADVVNSVEMYVKCVIDVEWPAMVEGRSALYPCSPQAREIGHAVGALEPATGRESNIQQALFATYGDFLSSRRERVFYSQRNLPGPLWFVLGLGVIIMTSLIWFMPIKSRLIHAIISGVISLSLASIVAVILILTTPF
ncbi:DUF4239 domain-containing protein [Streptomyces sp. HNM0645]|uniref:bestrophin-like domain n=1 Tax=Streptomyces sp. HNM0645 TaxID=2782343 RepID=UPI0024B7C254|nr:DUF4239 domain-containing protein [Streptomyces sp. HNM0645]MDI9886033.1 DUF4239 domain-containing protein [Streptomyces sp. HNM0645]